MELNGIKVFGDWSIEKVVGCTATLIRDSGSGLIKLFHDLLRAQGAIFRRADDLCCYEGGGLSANIRGELVLECWADSPQFLAKLPKLCWEDGRDAGLLSSRVHKGRLLVKLQGVERRTTT